MKKRAQLTEKEIDALLTLISIAGAGTENEGDYAGFDYKAMDRALEKLQAMRANSRRPQNKPK